MPKIQELTNTLKEEEALSLKLANKVEFLTGELDKARRKLASEISENENLKRVIEEWKKMASGLMAQLVTRNTELSIAEEAGEYLSQVLNLKHKRCLAMYRYCAIKALYELDCKGNDVGWKWYSKWMHKWYKLAKEPTWAKFLQLIHKEAK